MWRESQIGGVPQNGEDVASRQNWLSKRKSGGFGCLSVGHTDCVLAVVPVQVKAKKGSTILQVYAFLDRGSSSTFCSEQLMRKLKLKGRKTKFQMKTMNQENCQVVSGLEVAALNELNCLIWTHKPICLWLMTTFHVKRTEVLGHIWTILEIPDIDADINLVTGTNVPEAMEPWQVINRGKGPYALKTLLGCLVNEPLRESNDIVSISTTVKANRICIAHIEKMLIKQYSHDFN